MVEESYKVLKFVSFTSTDQWDVKSFVGSNIQSKYKIKRLDKYITHQTTKKKLFNYPNETFKILGISNEIGMFDAYEELGKNINQPYIIVKDDFLAYNPYRVNVGSIGIKTKNIKNDFISPAYVVFSCSKVLLPKYLFLLMKTNTFNLLIRENTTGSVRQTLSYDNLAKIKIPIPDSLEEQNRLVKKYESTIVEAETCEKEVERLEKSIDKYLFDTLGIVVSTDKSSATNLLSFTSLNKLFKWGVDFNLNSVNPKDVFKSTKYKNAPITSFCEINPITKYSDDVEDISFVPMECVSDIYGEITSTKRGKTFLSKGYTRFQEKDVIWAKITPCMQNGKSAVAKDLINGFAYGSTEFHVFRAFDGKALPEYIHAFMRTAYVRKVAQTYFTGSAGQQRVGTDFLEALTLPAIPIVYEDPNTLTQTVIVNHLSNIKEQIKFLRKKSETLRQLAKKEFEEAVFENPILTGEKL